MSVVDLLFVGVVAVPSIWLVSKLSEAISRFPNANTGMRDLEPLLQADHLDLPKAVVAFSRICDYYGEDCADTLKLVYKQKSNSKFCRRIDRVAKAYDENKQIDQLTKQQYSSLCM